MFQVNILGKSGCKKPIYSNREILEHLEQGTKKHEAANKPGCSKAVLIKGSGFHPAQLMAITYYFKQCLCYTNRNVSSGAKNQSAKYNSRRIHLNGYEYSRRIIVNAQEKANLIWAIADKLVGVYKHHEHEYALVVLPMCVIKRFNDTLLPTWDAVLQKNEALKAQRIQVRDNFLYDAAGYRFFNTSPFYAGFALVGR